MGSVSQSALGAGGSLGTNPGVLDWATTATCDSPACRRATCRDGREALRCAATALTCAPSATVIDSTSRALATLASCDPLSSSVTGIEERCA
jgi:hypothetical protein